MIALLSSAGTVLNGQEGTRMVHQSTGPHTPIEVSIVVFASILVLVTLALSIKMLLNPREDDPTHIKHIVIRDEVLANE